MRRFVSLNTSNLSNTSEIRVEKDLDNSFHIGDSDREEIIVMIMDFGWTDDQILQMLPHVSKGSISAYRAHVTRGTYEQGAINGDGKATDR